MSRMIAVVRTDLIWFLLGDIVADFSGVNEYPDDPDGAARLHSIYLATQKAVLHAIMGGELPVREWPLWSKVPVSVLDQLGGDDAPGLGIAISDLHTWLKSTAYPVAKTPQALFEVFNRRWAALTDQPERTAITTGDGETVEIVGLYQGPGRPSDQMKADAYAYYDDLDRQIDVAKDMQARGVEITKASLIDELIRLSDKEFPGSKTGKERWRKKIRITAIQQKLNIRQKRRSERLKTA